MQEIALTDKQKEQLRMNLESGMRIIKGKHPELDVNDRHKVLEFLLEEMAVDSIFLPEAAAVLTDCLVKATGWKIISLVGESFGGTAVVSLDGAYATYPELVVGKASRNTGGNTLLHYFNMIIDGSLPPSSAGRYTVLS